MFLKELKRIRIQWSEGLFGVGIWFTYIIVDCESPYVLYDTSHSTHTPLAMQNAFQLFI